MSLSFPGAWRGWDANSGYYHNQSLTSQQRFLPEPGNPESDPWAHITGRSDRPDLAGQWYYWRIKPDQVTIWTRLFPWICYVTHQLSVWIVLYLAQRDKQLTPGKKYTTTLTKYNWIMLGLNVFFHLLHLVQTHTTYDPLAHDMTVSSAQASIMLLPIVVLLLEYNERGMLLGWPSSRDRGKVSNKLRLNMKPIYWIRKYHGYAFSWGAIHTIWFHSMENTYGHALGFVHTWMFLLQASLMYSRLHLNEWWRLLQQAWVVLHAGMVAYQTTDPSSIAPVWPRFTFGLLLPLVLTQIFILPFWKKIPVWTRIFPFLVLMAIIIGNYSWIPDKQGRTWVGIQEIIRIPGFYYMGVIIMFVSTYIFVLIDEKIRQRFSSTDKDPSPTVRGLNLLFILVIYIIMNIASVVRELYPLPLKMFVAMIIYVVAFLLAVALTLALHTHTLPRRRMPSKIAPMAEETGGKIGMELPPKGVQHSAETETIFEPDKQSSGTTSFPGN